MSMSVGSLVMVGESGMYTCSFICMCVLRVFVGVSASFGDFLRKCAWLRV